MRLLLARYGIVLACLVVATLVRLAFDPLLGNQYAFGMYYPVVMLAGLYGGLGPGLLAMVLGAVVGDYFFVPPRGSFWFFGSQHSGIFLFYFFMSILFLVLASSLRVSRRRAEEAQSRLRELNETLEQRVIERTAVARRRADQLRVLAAELTLAEQHERRRLAQVLHDHLQQMLVAARMMLSRLRNRPNEETRLEMIGKIDHLLEQCLAESRSLTVELSPPVLYEGGLKAAIPWLAHRMEEMHGLAVKVRVDPEAEPRDEAVRVLLFQAARELLLNVVKHAQAGSASIEMAPLDGDRLELIVADDGVGFDPSTLAAPSARSGFGLFSIRERLELIGGRVETNATPGKGTRIRLESPRDSRPIADSA
jgi:signal transduction histidine kinase